LRAMAKARTKSKATKKLRVLFGQRVRELRTRRGFSLEALGERAGVDDKYLQAVETARQNASVDIVEKIAAGLGVSIVDLFTFSEEAAASPKERISKSLGALGEDDLQKIAIVLEAIVGR
jgi:transcriptional regulator with XRE-family HTH domain